MESSVSVRPSEIDCEYGVSQKRHRRWHPARRTKTDGIPVSRPSPCHDTKISETENFIFSSFFPAVFFLPISSCCFFCLEWIFRRPFLKDFILPCRSKISSRGVPEIFLRRHSEPPDLSKLLLIHFGFSTKIKNPKILIPSGRRCVSGHFSQRHSFYV